MRAGATARDTEADLPRAIALYHPLPSVAGHGLAPTAAKYA